MLQAPPVLVRDRLIGGLVGLVVGDALGVPVEFCPRRELDRAPVTGMRAFGTHAQPRGTWSDDGALALAHAAAFVRHGWDPQRHLEAFADWHERGAYTAHGRVFDVGGTTHAALRRFLGGQPAEASGGRAARDNGNGSLMRILPASCWWAGDPPETVIARIGAASSLTHAHPRSRLACAWHALIAEGLLSRVPLHESLARAEHLLAPLLPDEERAVFAPLLASDCLRWPRERVRSDGYVVSTLTAACWCLHRHDGYAEAVLAAVNLGDDADTTGAVTGGLAGLRCGFAAIPQAWVACLPHSSGVVALAERFADACLARAGAIAGSQHRRVPRR